MEKMQMSDLMPHGQPLLLLLPSFALDIVCLTFDLRFPPFVQPVGCVEAERLKL